MDFLFNSAYWWNVYGIGRVIFILLDIALVVLLVYTLKEGWHFRPRLHGPPEKGRGSERTLRATMFRDRWKDVKGKFAVGTPEAFRVALIDADAFVDDVLKQSGYNGEHMADRLSQISREEIPSVDRIWRAHRLRNDIVHTPGFMVSEADAQAAFEDYEAFLKELKVIE